MKNFIKKKPIFIGLILYVFSLTAQAEFYYWQWANNIFDVVEVQYMDLFYPPEDTHQLNLPEGIFYYRLYNTGNGLLVFQTNDYGQHVCVYNGASEEWLYLDTLDNTDLMLCRNSCRPSLDNDGDWWNDPGNDPGNDPDYEAGWCYSPCSWVYSTHTCNCD